MGAAMTSRTEQTHRGRGWRRSKHNAGEETREGAVIRGGRSRQHQVARLGSIHNGGEEVGGEQSFRSDGEDNTRRTRLVMRQTQGRRGRGSSQYQTREADGNSGQTDETDGLLQQSKPSRQG